jgi:ribosome-associated toxin RatA of RatAB toxin-antitoxin module
MRSVKITLHSMATDADAAFRRITEFDRYPEFVDEVRSVVLRPRESGGAMVSQWEIVFRNGPLRWSEVDYIQPALRRIVFEQITGDFEVFRGTWLVEAVADGCEITFEAAFDFGIPSLAGVLEPIAAKVLKEGIALIVDQLLGGATVVDDPAIAAAVTARLAARRAVAEPMSA